MRDPAVRAVRPEEGQASYAACRSATSTWTAFGSNYVVRGGQGVRKDTKTHQDRWLAIDPDTCVLVAPYLGEIRTDLAKVGRLWRRYAQ